MLGFSPCQLSLFQVRRSSPVLIWRVCQTRLYWIVLDVRPVLPMALLIVDAHVGESPLPDLASKPQFLVGPKREAALDQLHYLFKTHLAGNGDQDVNVVWHGDEVMDGGPPGPHG